MFNSVIVGAWRMDWGFGNPNITASLLVSLSLCCWLLSGIRSSKGFYWALFLSGGWGFALLHTLSRGGALGLICGGVLLLAGTVRQFQRRHFFWVIAVICLWVIYGSFLGVSERSFHGLSGKDASVSNRWLIYQHLPQILMDSPDGWGKGLGGDAYTQWYEPMGMNLNYLNLISGHFTRLAENNWWIRIGYLCMWGGLAGMLLYCWLAEHERIALLTLAIWAGFGLCDSFTFVSGHWVVWLIPLAFLAGTLLVVRGRLFSIKSIIWTGRGAAGLVLSGVATVSILGCKPVDEIRFHDGIVSVGNHEKSNLSIIGIDKRVLGRFYGHRIREIAKEVGAIKVAWPPGIVSSPHKGSTSFAVLSGNAADIDLFYQARTELEHIVLINPVSGLSDWEATIKPDNKLTVIYGEHSRLFSQDEWIYFQGKETNQIRLIEIPAVGDFIPQWDRSLMEVIQSDR